MRQFIIILLLLIIITNSSPAQNKWGLVAGVHYSRFYDVNAEPRPGFSLGVERCWSLNNSTFIQSGLIYSNCSSALENKTIGWSGWDTPIYLKDIICSTHYFSFPIILKKQFIKWTNSSLFFTTGYLFNLGIYDNSKIIEKKLLLYESFKQQNKFDYEATYEIGPFHSLENSTISWDWGLGFENCNYSITIIMNFVVLGEVKSIQGAFLHHQYAVLGILTTYYI